jgi:hypothetical protein
MTRATGVDLPPFDKILPMTILLRAEIFSKSFKDFRPNQRLTIFIAYNTCIDLMDLQFGCILTAGARVP